MAKILLEPICSEIEVKKSRFLCTLGILKKSEELKAIVGTERKNHPKARHVCSAYILQNGHRGSNDDHEPHGTAGRPMLECLMHSELVDVYVLVTRYFGGTLLGTGGLVHAYQDVVKQALVQAKTKELVQEETGSIELSYACFSQIKNFLEEQEILYEAQFAHSIILQYKGKKEACQTLQEKIQNFR